MTPEQIARGLTKAQREVIVSLTDNWSWYNRAGNSAAWALAGKGLAKRQFEKHPKGRVQAQYRLTQLGLAVRAELERIADE